MAGEICWASGCECPVLELGDLCADHRSRVRDALMRRGDWPSWAEEIYQARAQMGRPIVEK